MNKLDIDGVTWGEIKLKSGSTYRKLIDGKWTPMRKHEVPQSVVEAFEGVVVNEPTPEEVNEVAENVDNSQEDVNDFGFSGEAPEIDWKAAYEDAITHSTDNLTLKDLADYMAVNRSAMFRELKNLKEEKFVAVKGKRITLLYK